VATGVDPVWWTPKMRAWPSRWESHATPPTVLPAGVQGRGRRVDPQHRRLIYALGYGATAWIVGRRILREPTAWILAFLVGWGILRVLALIPILGGLVWFAAVVFGLGALLVAIWRARTTSRATPAAA
jgi:hypothetical protein